MPQTRTSADISEEGHSPVVAVTKKLKYENSWIFLGKDEVFETNTSTQVITLMHPGHLKLAKFLINKTSKKMYEIQTYDEPHRSWFIGETVKSDGSMYLTTLIDPVFFILQHLKELCSNRVVPLEHVLQSDTKTDLKELNGLVTDLSMIGDMKGPADLCAYKYNEEKALVWLENKVKRVVKVLKKKKMHVNAGAVSATFITSVKKEDEIEDELYFRCAFGIISEYLDEYFTQALHKKLNIQSNVIPNAHGKRKSDADDVTFNKKVKTENVKERIENVPISSPPSWKKPTKPVAVPTRETQPQKKTMSLMSFFNKEVEKVPISAPPSQENPTRPVAVPTRETQPQKKGLSIMSFFNRLNMF